MKFNKIIFGISLMSICTYSIGQNSFNAIKTSRRGGILTTLVNPANLATMPQKIDVNVIGFDIQVANNAINFTSDEMGKTGDLKDRFFNAVGTQGLNVNINADVIGPSFAFAVNKKLALGLMTRARMNVALNNIDVAFGKALVDGTYNPGTTLPYNTPTINNMSANVIGWGEVGLTAASEVYNYRRHSLSMGGTFKVLFPGAYGNTYLNNFKMTLDTTSGGNLVMRNGSGNLGIEYSGSSDPIKDIGENLIGGPKGVAFDLGLVYQFKHKDRNGYIVKLGASLLDVGSVRFNSNQATSRQFVINSSATVNPSSIGGNDFDEIIANIKSTGAVSEIPADSSFNVNLPMAYNFLADVNVWKPFYVTMNLQRRASDVANPRNVLGANYFTVTPRFVTRFFEAYVPFSFSEIQGNTIGAGMKLGPLYFGSSSIISAMGSTNKAVDFHFGIRSGFGKQTNK